MTVNKGFIEGIEKDLSATGSKVVYLLLLLLNNKVD